MCSARRFRVTPANITWREGLPYSDSFGDVYFSREGGLDEADHVFLKHNQLPDRWLNGTAFTIAETGFGTGLNFLVALKRWHETAPPNARLHFISVEKFPLLQSDLRQAHLLWPELTQYSRPLLDAYPELVAGYHRLEFLQGRVTLTLMLGDALDMYKNLEAKVDAWFLDGFAPSKSDQMWQPELFKQIARLSHAGATFSTFTVAGAVRCGLIASGFEVTKVAGFGRKREMLSGIFVGQPVRSDRTPWFALPDKIESCSRTVAVIGAGFAGVATAYALARRGWAVTLIERHSDVAQEASGNLLGVVMPRLGVTVDPESRFYLTAFLHVVRWLSELKRQHPELIWQDSGVLQLLEPKKAQRFTELSLPESLLQIVNSARASHLCGLPVQSGGLFYPLGGSLNPAGLCRILVDSESELIQRCFHKTALSIEKNSDGWCVRDEAGMTLAEAPVVVLANGYEVTHFKPCAELPVSRVRGQLTYLQESSVGAALNMPVCYDGYITPAYENQHVVGASYHRSDQSGSLKKSDQNQILNSLYEQFPVMQTDELSLKSGRVAFRATSKDHLPLVGPVADEEWFRVHYEGFRHGRRPDTYPVAKYQAGLFVNVAHGSRGLVSIALSSEIIAAYLDGEPQPVPRDLLNRLHPARFLVNHLRRGGG
ncbi:MAG TPA: bifunctional tRNA (5-methylaminomethyl-2-thiouridine)(34)-methyltransferase MnmD/FAD-dependent 5-carboxymethylaminomethyl-2-thiouridine(34) oxidoreductase MnmC [Gammaproteobacteria bacterium]|nr:bifunctional tRNA (5-methylaminomethyl-2-thiouridine)(34)-methyltransferase MnmD/FAD-dependent 5-carboxymethylaminomethyl-2-thiouridine(34) oxidoreductase MnmC [Gammaproteobacteria bacterium]